MQKRPCLTIYLGTLFPILCTGCLIFYFYQSSPANLKLLVYLVPIVLILGVAIFFYYQKKQRIKRFNDLAHLSQIDWMNQEEFDYFVGELYHQLGYKVTLTKEEVYTHSDIVALCRKDSVTLKADLSKTRLDESIIQEAYEAKCFYDTRRAAVITNNYFTKSAIELALKLGVELIDRNKLVRVLKKAKSLYR